MSSTGALRAWNAAGFIEFLTNGGAVKRYHTVRTTRDQTIAEHSFGVAWLVYELSDGDPSVSLVMAALAHDMAEQYTGDMPAPAKRELGIYHEMHNLERQYLRKDNACFELNELEKTILDCADNLEGMLFCILQREMGNITIAYAYNRFRERVNLFHATPLGANKIFKTIFNHLEQCWRNAQ